LTREEFLFREFDLLFTDLFQKKQFYRRSIGAVAEKPLELEDIYRKLNVEKAGYISECIQDLIEGRLSRSPLHLERKNRRTCKTQPHYFDTVIDFGEMWS
jgi:hypothetical protein